MKQSTKVTIAALLSAAGAVLNAFATELGNGSEAEAPATAIPVEKPKKAKKEVAPAAEKPAEPAPAPAEEPAAPAAAEDEGTPKSYEELRAMIKPLVEGGQGADVKKVIAKYGTDLKDVSTKGAKVHADFERDLAALTY